MNNLPPDLYQELLSWLEDDDQGTFAMINRAIYSQLKKNVRVLWIPDNLDLKVAGFDDISCKSLSTTIDKFTTSLIHYIKKVQILNLYYRSLLPDSELQLISDWINNSNLGLKQLHFSNIMHSFSGLNILAYSNLRCLKLSYVSLEDVSSLNGIHELHLEYCHKIRNISRLNHNYKIVVKECKGITDYLNSFRNSKIIDIVCTITNLPWQPMQGCDFSQALEAREFYFDGVKCNKPLILPRSSSLLSVRAERLRGSFALPSEHHIQEIILRDCSGVISLLHFDRIYSVKLVNLNISSLEGLGSGNRVVEVDSCPLITDFSLLRHCDKLTILNCEGFQDMNQVRGVKELIFSPFNDNKVPKEMEGVTCLIFVRVTDDLLSLKFPSTLKKLIILYRFQTSSADIDLIKRLPSFLAMIPCHVEKIEVSGEQNTFRSLLKKGEISFPDFKIIEFKKGIHFFRKPVTTRV